MMASHQSIASGNNELCSSVAFGHVPLNGFYGLNNVSGKGSFVNGVDFWQSIQYRADIFPVGVTIEWLWPATASGSSFAYSYPLINYGASNYGNPFNVVGPWPMKIKDVTRLNVTYDITIGGNTNAFDILLDSFVTALPDSTNGDYVAEISFFAYCNSGLPLDAGLVDHTFSFGACKVGPNGSGSTQLCCYAVTGSAHRAILRGDALALIEVFDYFVSVGLLTGEEYIRGFQFGAEVQVPAAFNSLPHQGFMRVNALSYDWA